MEIRLTILQVLPNILHWRQWIEQRLADRYKVTQWPSPPHRRTNNQRAIQLCQYNIAPGKDCKHLYLIEYQQLTEILKNSFRASFQCFNHTNT